jgi:hypothetical protein
MLMLKLMLSWSERFANLDSWLKIKCPWRLSGPADRAAVSGSGRPRIRRSTEQICLSGAMGSDQPPILGSSGQWRGCGRGLLAAPWELGGPGLASCCRRFAPLD